MAISELALELDLGWTELGVNIVLGLLGGAVGGVFAARQIAERTERGRRQHAARTTLRASINSYRAGLKYKHDVIKQGGSYPGEWTSMAEDEALADTVLRELPYLSRRLRTRLHKNLVALCGAFDVELAERRLHVPEALRNHDSDGMCLTSALSSELAKGAAGGAVSFDDGLLRKAKKNGFEAEGAYEDAIRVLDEMAASLRP